MVPARNKLNIVETLLTSALSDFDISHEEFAKIIDEKVKYEGVYKMLIDKKSQSTKLRIQNTELRTQNSNRVV